MIKISIILPTFRKNSKEEVNNLNKIHCKTKGSGAINKEFGELNIDALHYVEHVLEPTLYSLSEQIFKDFEVILCHKYPKDVKNLVNDYKSYLNIKLLEEKSSIWHKIGDYPTVNNNRNTGIIHSKGELLFFLDDMCIFGNDLLENVWNNYKNDYYTTCKTIKRIKINEDNQITGVPKLKFANIGDIIPNTATWSYGMSVSLEECLEINGFDEIYDGSFGGTDMDFGRRLNMISDYKRKAGQTMYEFGHYIQKIHNKRTRDDEVMRKIFKQSPIPRYIKANSWKPTKNEMLRYATWHEKNKGELDSNWNAFMLVPYINLREERNVK